MTTNKHFSQFELFPGDSEKAPEKPRMCFQLKDLTLTPENIIVLCIVSVVILVLFFALGVERGRNVIASQVKSPQEMLKDEEAIIVLPEIKPMVESSGTSDSTVEQATEKLQVIDIEQLKEIEPIDKGPRYTIQVASFKLEQNAKEEAKGLDNFGADSFIVPKGSYSIVCIGRFDEREEAKQFSRKLKAKYKDLLIRRL